MIIGIISDIHQNSEADREILNTTIRNISDHGATGLLMGGDIGDYHHDRKTAISAFIKLFPKKHHRNLLLMLGNHDVRTGAKADGSLDPDLIDLYHSYLDQCGITYQKGSMCIDAWIDGYHFLLLNSDFGLKDMMELNKESIVFLTEKLAEKAHKDRPIFVMTHQALNATHWRAGLFGGFGRQDAELKQLFSEYPQIVLLNGHIHNGFGVIESIQRPFGTLIEIPSLTRSENGVTQKGTGYLLRVSKDRLVFEAWDFYHNTHLQQYDRVISLPTLSVLAKKISPSNDDEMKQLTAKANLLMNKKYANDIPNGGSTYRPPEYYGFEKIYPVETWAEIDVLREKIIAKDINGEIEFQPLLFKNREIITEKMIGDKLAEYDNVAIELYDGHWSKEIYLPKVNKKNQQVKITSNATYSSTVVIDNISVNLSKGDELVFSSRPHWVLNK